MKFDYVEYLNRAKTLARSPDEVSRRTAISRAYYAVYIAARRRLGQFGPRQPAGRRRCIGRSRAGAGEVVAMMTVKRVALIGNSGAGKSTCIKLIRDSMRAAEMDGIFPATPTLAQALNWILGQPNAVKAIAVSVYTDMLLELADAKESGRDADRWGQILFVHLQLKDQQQLDLRLTSTNAAGERRDPNNIRLSRDNATNTRELCERIADVTIHTDRLDAERVTQVVRMLAGMVQDPPLVDAP